MYRDLVTAIERADFLGGYTAVINLHAADAERSLLI